MSKANSNKRFKLPGNNRNPNPTPPVTRPGVVTLDAQNAPLWQAKFMEEIRDELRKMNRFFEAHA